MDDAHKNLIPPREEDIAGLVDVMINEEGSMCTVQFEHRYIITLYSRDKSKIIVKHVGSKEKANAWIDENFWHTPKE